MQDFILKRVNQKIWFALFLLGYWWKCLRILRKYLVSKYQTNKRTTDWYILPVLFWYLHLILKLKNLINCPREGNSTIKIWNSCKYYQISILWDVFLLAMAILISNYMLIMLTFGHCRVVWQVGGLSSECLDFPEEKKTNCCEN